MPRPRRCRRCFCRPCVTYFKPAGIVELGEIILSIDEFESVRLKDLQGLEQEQAAKKMKISQPTFNRLIRNARKKIADAIVNGKAIVIKGGNYKMVVPRRGMGRMKGYALGPGGECTCIKCGIKIPHARGIPCYQQKCPKCESPMIRA